VAFVLCALEEKVLLPLGNCLCQVQKSISTERLVGSDLQWLAHRKCIFGVSLFFYENNFAINRGLIGVHVKLRNFFFFTEPITKITLLTWFCGPILFLLRLAVLYPESDSNSIQAVNPFLLTHRSKNMCSACLHTKRTKEERFSFVALIEKRSLELATSLICFGKFSF